jgi:hypothetical protein
VVVRTAGLVAYKGVIFPTVPESGDHLIELPSPFIAVGMTEMLVATEILRFGDIVESD